MRSTILKITVPTLVLLLIFISYTNLERFEPTADTFTDSEKIVEIAVRANSMEQVVLGELYKQGLDRHGRPAVINMESLRVKHSIESCTISMVTRPGSWRKNTPTPPKK